MWCVWPTLQHRIEDAVACATRRRHIHVRTHGKGTIEKLGETSAGGLRTSRRNPDRPNVWGDARGTRGGRAGDARWGAAECGGARHGPARRRSGPTFQGIVCVTWISRVWRADRKRARCFGAGGVASQRGRGAGAGTGSASACASFRPANRKPSCGSRLEYRRGSPIRQRARRNGSYINTQDIARVICTFLYLVC